MAYGFIIDISISLTYLKLLTLSTTLNQLALSLKRTEFVLTYLCTQVKWVVEIIPYQNSIGFINKMNVLQGNLIERFDRSFYNALRLPKISDQILLKNCKKIFSENYLPVHPVNCIRVA